MMNKYTEYLWKSSIQNQYQLDGHSILPTPIAQPLPIAVGTPRDIEVLTFSLFYENNLLNNFLYRYNPDVFTSPLCDCKQEEQTANHLLFRCPLINQQLRLQAYNNFQTAVGDEVAEIESTIILVNASRNPAFMKSVIDIVKSAQNRLRADIVL